MSKYRYKSFTPVVATNVYISPTSTIIGQCELAAGVNIWFGAVLRGDVNRITIGENTNIQDLSMLHVTEVGELIVGKNVTIGHSVILHACTVGDGSLIGMGAKVLDGAVIGKNCLVAAGSVVPPRKSYPEGSLIVGSPAKVKRKLNPDEITQYSNHYKSYLKYAEEFQNSQLFEKIAD